MNKLFAECQRNILRTLAGVHEQIPIMQLYNCSKFSFYPKVVQELWSVPLVSEFLNDGTDHIIPVRTTGGELVESGATFADLADAVERAFIVTLPKEGEAFDYARLRTASTKGNKDVRSGVSPHAGSLSYA